MTHLVPLLPESNLWLQQGKIKTIDIETGFDDDDFISIALPDFPLDEVNIASSFVYFTSNSEGNFVNGPTDAVAFDQSEETLMAGDSEFRFKQGLLDNVDRSSITGVRFEIDATDAATFRVLAIRALSKDWLYAPIDIDTLKGQIVRPVSLNGEASPTPEAPFDTWPNIFRSDDLPSSGDPTPIDAKLTASFYTGTIDGANQFSIYLRENAVDYQTQLELDTLTQDDLSGLPQPDFGEALYLSRTQLDIDGIVDSVAGPGIDSGAAINTGLTQTDLDGVLQFDLERKPDLLSAIWIEVRISWDSDGSVVEVYDADGNPFYSFELALNATTAYVALIDLVERSIHIKIYEREGLNLGPLVFDSTEIQDPEVFKRRKGRIGWYASLEDGDAFIDNIVPRELNFSEYRSHPFESLTPVAGVSLQAGATPDADLFKGIDAGPWGGQFYANPDRSPESFRIHNTALAPLQGIRTNYIFFDDFFHTEISFNLYVAQAALDVGSMTIFLWNGIQPIALPINKLAGNVWNEVRIDLVPLAERLLPGYYALAIVQSVAGLPNDWLIDKLSVKRRNIEWAGRGYVDDAWSLHEDDWVPFANTVNKTTGGILFTERSKKLQVRAKALRQNAQIGQVRTVPKYAELGRTDWIDTSYLTQAPSVNFTSITSAYTVTFTSTATKPSISQVWAFGDGAEDTGPSVQHVYKSAGTYPATLTVTDPHGTQFSHTKSVTVS